MALARYLFGGELDEDFGDAGTTTTDFGSYFDQAHGVALQTGGDLDGSFALLVLRLQSTA